MKMTLPSNINKHMKVFSEKIWGPDATDIFEAIFSPFDVAEIILKVRPTYLLLW